MGVAMTTDTHLLPLLVALLHTGCEVLILAHKPLQVTLQLKVKGERSNSINVKVTSKIKVKQVNHPENIAQYTFLKRYTANKCS